MLVFVPDSGCVPTVLVLVGMIVKEVAVGGVVLAGDVGERELVPEVDAAESSTSVRFESYPEQTFSLTTSGGVSEIVNPKRVVRSRCSHN